MTNSYDQSDWLSINYIQILLFLLVFIIIYLVDYISNINSILYGVTQLPGITGSIGMPKKNKKVKTKM